MSKNVLQYGQFIEEECCEDCNYAGGYNLMGDGRGVQICPECGGQLITIVGRWTYTENKSWWLEYLWDVPKTYHGFLRGRDINIDPPKTAPSYTEVKDDGIVGDDDTPAHIHHPSSLPHNYE